MSTTHRILWAINKQGIIEIEEAAIPPTSPVCCGNSQGGRGIAKEDAISFPIPSVLMDASGVILCELSYRALSDFSSKSFPQHFHILNPKFDWPHSNS